MPLLIGIFIDEKLSPWRRRVTLVFCAASFIALVVVTAKLAPPSEAYGICVQMTDFPKYLTQFLRLISGVSAYEYFAGALSQGAMSAHDNITAVLIGGLVIVGGYGLMEARRFKELGLLVGTLASIGLFFLFGGMKNIDSGHSRHALILAPPTVLALALCLSGVPLPDRWDRLRIAFATIVGAVWLTAFSHYYFGEFARSGGRSQDASHAPYHTGPKEPKLAAYEIIEDAFMKRGQPMRRLTVIVDEWHLQWPIRFLAEGFAEVAVIRTEELHQDQNRFRTHFEQGAIAVGYQTGGLKKHFEANYPPDRVERRDIPDSAGRPFLTVFWLK